MWCCALLEENKIELCFFPFIILQYTEVITKYDHLLLFCLHMVILFNCLLTFPNFRKQGVHFSSHYSFCFIVTAEDSLWPKGRVLTNDLLWVATGLRVGPSRSFSWRPALIWLWGRRRWKVSHSRIGPSGSLAVISGGQFSIELNNKH